MHSIAKLALVIMVLLPGASVAGQCGIRTTPMAGFTWFRSEGWPTPGVDDAESIAPLSRGYGWPQGITVSQLKHKIGYHLVFPSMVFEDAGQRKRMQEAGFTLSGLLRWEMSGKTFAYSYTILSDTVACGFSIDLIDNLGDGKFRILKSTDRTVFGPPQPPAWLSKPAS